MLICLLMGLVAAHPVLDPGSGGGYPIQSWVGVPHPVLDGGTPIESSMGRGYLIQSLTGVVPWGTPHPDLGWGTPIWTWDTGYPIWTWNGGPARPGIGYPHPDLGQGTPLSGLGELLHQQEGYSSISRMGYPPPTSASVNRLKILLSLILRVWAVNIRAETDFLSLLLSCSIHRLRHSQLPDYPVEYVLVCVPNPVKTFACSFELMNFNLFGMGTRKISTKTKILRRIINPVP